MAKLVRWETPFTDLERPSVGLLITTASGGTDILKAVVAPTGIDTYPKYLVNFGKVIAFTCFEEAHAPERDYGFATIEEENLCAYEHIDSPWLESYSAWSSFYFRNKTDSFLHYLIFGGDNNIEVITPDKPTIDVVENRTILKIEYEV